MNSLPLISHRLFVAAVSEADGAPAKSRRTPEVIHLAADPDVISPDHADYPGVSPADAAGPAKQSARAEHP